MYFKANVSRKLILPRFFVIFQRISFVWLIFESIFYTLTLILTATAMEVKEPLSFDQK
jgi:hypothetical protein